MSRDYRVYLEDVLEAVSKIRQFTSGLTLATFSQDAKTLDAVVRNLEIVGEQLNTLRKMFELDIRVWIGRRSPGFETS